MFAGKNHIHAIATVVGTMGGFQAQPEWFKNLAKQPIFQILLSAVLVYQGGGALDIGYSIAIAIGFYILMNISSSLKIAPAAAPVEKAPAATEEAATEEEAAADKEAEEFSNFYKYRR
tara:strand:+ start:18324 stop:18677 length:354 start_codon:yes stop_codon:yes gene_type:complete